MLLLKVIVLVISVSCISTVNDKDYCQVQANSPIAFLSGVLNPGILIAQNPLYGDDLITIGSATPTLVDRATLTNAIVFPQTRASIADALFCVGGDFFSADVDGDGYDDILCHDASNSFTYKLYNHQTKLYSATETLTTSSQFNCLFSFSRIIIGNFNGNGPDEIICIPSAATDFSTAIMYSPPSCSKTTSSVKTMGYNPFAHGQFGKTRSFSTLGHDHGHHDYHDYSYHHSHRHARHSNHYACTSGQLFSFTAANLPNCDPSSNKIIVGVIGTGFYESLICHQTDNTISYYSGSVTLSASMFGIETDISTITTACVLGSHVLLAADVDGDGDSDLVCVHGTYNAGPFRNDISFQTSSGVFDNFSQRSTSCPEYCFLSGATNAGISWYVLDFDGDGSDDIMCKYTDNPPTSNILLQASIARPFY